MNFKKIIFFILIVIFNLNIIFSQSLPELTGRVVDNASILSSSQAAEIERLLEIYENNTKHQMVVVTINSLEGYTIEEYSINLALKWKIGRKEYNDGIIILIALSDRKMRIEVGYGLEGDVTDAQSFLIIDRIMKPAFRNNDYYTGIKGAIYELGRLTNANLSTDDITNRKINNYYNSYKRNDSRTLVKFLTYKVILIIIVGFLLGLVIRILFKKMRKTIFRTPFIIGLVVMFILTFISVIIILIFFRIYTAFFFIPFFIGLSGFRSRFGGGFTIGSGGYSGGSFGWGDSDGGSGFGGGFSGGGGDFGGGGASGSW